MFTTLYDSRTEGLTSLMKDFLTVGICLFIGGLVIMFYWKAKRQNSSSKFLAPLIGFMALGMSAIFLFISLIPLYLTPRKARRIFDNNLYLVVEGVPKNYHPMPKEGHDKESFEIQGVKFHYSDYVPRFGYHNAASHGGVIHSNNYYRITYYPDQDSLEAGGPSILKIEIRN
jgi:hypothetical protein